MPEVTDSYLISQLSKAGYETRCRVAALEAEVSRMREQLDALVGGATPRQGLVVSEVHDDGTVTVTGPLTEIVDAHVAVLLRNAMGGEKAKP